MADLKYSWWVEDGRTWIRHDCIDGRDDYALPRDGRWTTNTDGLPSPSFNCNRCGHHVILTYADKIESSS